MITKDELLNCSPQTFDVETSKGTIRIRALSWNERSEIEQIRSVGTVTTTKDSDGTYEKREVPLTEYTEKCNIAMKKAIMYSLSVDEQWTCEEVERVPLVVLCELYERIEEINDL